MNEFFFFIEIYKKKLLSKDHQLYYFITHVYELIGGYPL
jgi:hypothetical protein